MRIKWIKWRMLSLTAEREREGTCEVHDKETRQFEDKRSLSDSKNLPT